MWNIGVPYDFVGDYWQRKKARDYQSGQDHGRGQEFVDFPINEFKKSAVLMGATVSDFYCMCMAEFQVLRDTHLLKNGYNEDGSDPNTMSLDELDNLKQVVESSWADTNRRT